MQVCLNCSNLHYGGGVQVATSLIQELSTLSVSDLDITVLSSTEIWKNVKQLGVNIAAFKSYEIADVYGLSALLPKNVARFAEYDVVFTLFGPDYIWSSKAVRLTGFAQPWIIYPDNEAKRYLSIIDRIKLRLKFYVQEWFFKRPSALVVEAEHVRQGLIDRRLADPHNVFVVHNCLSALYRNPQQWAPIGVERRSDRFSIGFVGRDYPHKNTSILPEVKHVLESEHGVVVDFYVTLNESEWMAKSVDFQQSIINVGALSVAACPSFYQEMDAIIFPSLLECFSATPLEAMAMEKPLFASDRRFVRDVCGEFPWYFDPLDPSSIADSIASYMVEAEDNKVSRLRSARDYALGFSSPKKRALEYLEIIKSLK